MKRKKNKEDAIKWLKKPEPHDYPAAQSYLTLLFSEAKAKDYTNRLKRSPVVEFKAKDIFRASALSLLGVSNSHVETNRKKIKKGVPMSPILLVRDENRGKVVVADGYHRICAVYTFAEDAIVPCKII